MTCKDQQSQLMAYLDNELTGAALQAFESHLSTCADCRSELEEFRRLKQATDRLQLNDPEDRVWHRYWDNVYNRIERGIGWLLFSVGGLAVLLYGGFKLIEDLIRSPQIGLFAKCSLAVLTAGVAVLFVSIVRERFFFRSHDRYRDVLR